MSARFRWLRRQGYRDNSVPTARWILTLSVVAQVWAGATDAEGLYKRARQAGERGDYRQAYLLSSQAVALDPERPEYWQFSQAVRRRGLEGVKVETGHAAAEAPVGDVITEAELKEAREALPPAELDLAAGAKSFNLRGDAKRLFEEVGKAYGLEVVFDSDYQAGQPVQFRMENAGWREALRALEAVTSSFVVPLSGRVAMVAKDTAQKRVELEKVMTVIVPYGEPLSPQDVQEGARAVQSAFDMTKMAIDNNRRQVLFRDRVSRLKPALALFRQLMTHRAQVVVEVELLSISRDSSLNYGIKLPTSFPLFLVNNPTKLQYTPLVLESAAAFGWGKSRIGVGIADTAIFASMARTETQSVMKAELRGVDGQAAQLHVGDKYPVMTAGYFGETEGTGTTYRPPPTVNFEDLGIVLKVTPKVHGVDSVSMELEAEFKSLTGAALNGIPVISNRKFTMRVRTTFEETAVIAGLQRESVSQSWSGLPLTNLTPGLGSRDRSGEETRMLLTVRPRLVNLPPSEEMVWAVRSGSEARPLSPLD